MSRIEKAMTGNEIRRARKARGLSVAELARRADVPYFTVYSWESGRSRQPVKADHTARILAALDGVKILQKISSKP